MEEHILKGYYVFLIGQKDHPETIGTYGFCDGNCSIIENEEDITAAFDELNQKNMNKIFVVSQTTFSLEKFEKYVKIIEKKINEINENCQKDIRKKEQAKVHADSLNVGQAKNVKEIEHQKKLEKVLNYNQTCNLIELEIKNTICNATRIRQEETEKISKQVDCMIIIGGKNSSNTRKLYDIAKKNCENTVIIETYKELEESLNGTNSMQENNNGKDVNKKFLEKIKTSNKIGIMAGASTPKESIEEVIDFIKLEH